MTQRRSFTATCSEGREGGREEGREGEKDGGKGGWGAGGGLPTSPSGIVIKFYFIPPRHAKYRAKYKFK